MRQPRKSNPSSMWQTLVFSSDRRKPIGASTAADLIPERFGVAAGAVDHDHEVVRVADESHGRDPGTSTLGASPLRAERFPLGGEVLVEDRQGDVGQQRREDAALGGAGDRLAVEALSR